MTLILTNEEIESLFSLDECFTALEPALLDLGTGRAVNMPRQDLLVPGPLAQSYHGLKTSCASLPRAGVTTMRVTSDILTWPKIAGRQRRVKVPLAMGSKYVGLVFVFSIETGELLAIFPDGLMQAIRVGVTNALSAKYLALARPSLTHNVASERDVAWRAGDLFRWIETGKLDVRVGGTFPLHDAAKAHRELEARRSTGKILLVP